MEMKSLLRNFPAIFCLAGLVGCGWPSEEEQKYLHLSTDVLDSGYFEAKVQFETTSDNFFCKSYSFGRGHMVPKSQSMTYRIRSGEVAKVPLFLDSFSFCSWGLSLADIDYEKSCSKVPPVYIRTEGDPKLNPSDPELSDTLGISCGPRSPSGCHTCDRSDYDKDNELWDASYYIKATAKDVNLHVKFSIAQ